MEDYQCAKKYQNKPFTKFASEAFTSRFGYFVELWTEELPPLGTINNTAILYSAENLGNQIYHLLVPRETNLEVFNRLQVTFSCIPNTVSTYIIKTDHSA